MTQSTCCFLCRGEPTSLFFELPPMPTMDGVMSAKLEDALTVARGQICLRYCEQCGFIGNETFDPEKVNFDDYDFSNDHSSLFRGYVQALCQRLIDKYSLFGKTILDVGCGDGYFLETLCLLGQNKGVGIDSGFDHSNRKLSTGLDVTYIQDYYSDAHNTISADLVTCRLVIDLLSDPVQFLQTLRRNLDSQPNTLVYFEVPNAAYTFGDRVFWNVVYEHRSWFTSGSLAFLLETCGFDVLNIESTWNDEFLGIEAKIRGSVGSQYAISVKDRQELGNTIACFSSSFQALLTRCEAKITDLRNNKTKVIGWGAGARSVTFFNTFDIRDIVPYVVDINVNRQGKYVRGSGQKIVDPQFFIEYQPELVIITNPTYAEEIQQNIAELGLKPEFWVL